LEIGKKIHFLFSSAGKKRPREEEANGHPTKQVRERERDEIHSLIYL
jgi:hypothetical protein